MSFASAGMTSPTGNCHTFDATAGGYCRSEGIGAIVLRRSDDAKADQQPMHAMVRGVSVKQDGTSASLTAPNGQAQQGLLTAAHADGDIAPSTLALSEAHGTGTQLGDEVEVNGLETVFRPLERSRPLIIASSKAVFGHTEWTLILPLRAGCGPVGRAEGRRSCRQ